MADVTKEQESTLANSFEDILTALPVIREASQSAREILLANLVMIGEIPSPTFEESRRVEFLQNRFVEAGMHNSSTDEMGNALGILPGTRWEQNILVVAHVDTVHEATVDHTITLQPQWGTTPWGWRWW